MIRFLPAAEADLREVHDWYESRLLGLGETFVVALDAVLYRVQRAHALGNYSPVLPESEAFDALVFEAFRGWCSTP